VLPPVAEVRGRAIESAPPPAPEPVAISEEAPRVVAPPEEVAEVAPRAVTRSPEGTLQGRVVRRSEPGLPGARVLPRAGGPAAATEGVWPPLVLALSALGFGLLGLAWPEPRRSLVTC
jgi:hypothetical protein